MCVCVCVCVCVLCCWRESLNYMTLFSNHSFGSNHFYKNLKRYCFIVYSLVVKQIKT